jgi:hypothetical protein
LIYDRDAPSLNEIELNNSVLKLVQFLNLSNKVSEMLHHLKQDLSDTVSMQAADGTIDESAGNQLVEALTSMSCNDQDKLENYGRSKATEKVLMKLITNIKDDMETNSNDGTPNENTNSLLVPDKKFRVPQSPRR